MSATHASLSAGPDRQRGGGRIFAALYDPPPERLQAQALSLGEVAEGQALGAEFDPHGVSPIVVLLGQRRPAAVTGLVVAVHVDAVDGHLGSGRIPHVSQELSEAVSPLRADANASSAISGVGRLVSVRASRDHPDPCVVGLRRASADLVPVPHEARRVDLSRQAAAASRPSAPHVPDCAPPLAATVAGEAPRGLTSDRGNIKALNGNELAVALPSQIKGFHDLTIAQRTSAQNDNHRPRKTQNRLIIGVLLAMVGWMGVQLWTGVAPHPQTQVQVQTK